jgi:plasmid stabilization system protein ParE
MKCKLIISFEAHKDREAIGNYIAMDKPDAAAKEIGRAHV